MQTSLGITAIHVTHDREEAMVMADRIVILDAGRIAQIGPPEEVYNHPASPFVAAFMGAGNAIRLTSQASERRLTIQPGPHNDAMRLDDAARVAAAAPGRSSRISAASRRRLAGPAERSETELLLAGPDRAGVLSRRLLALCGRASAGSISWSMTQRRLAVGEAVRIRLPAARAPSVPGGARLR